MLRTQHAAASRNQIRQAIRKRRKTLTKLEQHQFSEQLLQRLVMHPKVLCSEKLAVYLANDGELDPMPFIKWCWQQKKSVYLPVLHPFSQGNLLFIRYHKSTKMKLNKFGILEPKLNVTELCQVQDLDLIFTPLVAFDNSGARMGMGGGFYDRTLSLWYTNATSSKSPQKLTPIGLAHDCQQIDSIDSEHWDIPLPEIITPTQVISQKLSFKKSLS